MASSEFDPCLSLPCQHNGTCHPISSATEGEEPFTCMCDEGFIGSKCEVDLCANQECPLNSLCIKGNCQCDSGFTSKSIFVVIMVNRKQVKVFYPIVFVSNIFPNSSFFQNSCQICIHFWINLELGKIFGTKTIG